MKELLFKAEAARFVKFRERMELSQTDLAKILETKQPNISVIEKGGRPLTFAQLRILRKKYDLNINWYITGQGLMFSGENDKSTIVSDISTLKKDYDALFSLYDNLKTTVAKLVRDVYAKD